MLYGYMIENKELEPLSEAGQVVLESVENQVSSCNTKQDVMKKFGISFNDLKVGKDFLKKNPLIMNKLKSCRSIKSIMHLMRSKEYKEALDKE